MIMMRGAHICWRGAFSGGKIWGKLELIINQRELLQHKSCGINFFYLPERL